MSRTSAVLLAIFAAGGCSNALSTQPVTPPPTPGPPTKYTARELYDVLNLGKDLTGKRVEVTGLLRAAEKDRKVLPAVTFEGGDGGNERITCYFDGPVSQQLARGDIITVTATVKGKVDGVWTLEGAKLTSVKPRKP